MYSAHAEFPVNLTGTDYAIADPHGEFGQVSDALRFVGFDINKDRLFINGDLGDRGPYSRDMLWWLDQPWCHAVRGNHCQSLIDYHEAEDKENYTHFGRKYNKQRAIDTGGAWFVNMHPANREAFCSALKTLPLAITVNTQSGPVGLVHAECTYLYWQSFVEALEEGDQSTASAAMLSRVRHNRGAQDLTLGVRAVVVGHTTVKAPSRLGNHIYIDTGACYKGHSVTVLNLRTLTPMFLAPIQIDSPRTLK